MNKITINKDAFKIDELQLEHGTITIGRAVDNDIHLDDLALSSYHAKIVTLFTATHIEDLNSTNGTYVNGKLIAEHTLHSGDIITLGSYQIAFISDHAVRKSPEKTMIMSSEKLKEMMDDVEQKKKKEASRPVYDPVVALTEPANSQHVNNLQDSIVVKSAHNQAQKIKRSESVDSSQVANVMNKEQIATEKANADVDELFISMQASQIHANNNRYLTLFAAVSIALIVAGVGIMLLM